jgi:heme a synthase
MLRRTLTTILLRTPETSSSSISSSSSSSIAETTKRIIKKSFTTFATNSACNNHANNNKIFKLRQQFMNKHDARREFWTSSSSGYLWNRIIKHNNKKRITAPPLPTRSRTFSSTTIRRTANSPVSTSARALMSTRNSIRRNYSSSITGTSLANPLVVGNQRAVKQVTYWLVGGCAWVFSMVVIGGMTRLTRSGLSMTDWKFEYEHPPLTLKDWEREFAKYKQSPEYKKTNIGMTLEEYKFIYWMEYGHRMWGRVLGIYFAVPLAYFSYKGYITNKLMGRLGIFFFLGAAQGMIGWWMVKSGLKQSENEKFDVPRVSPYRLAAHLTGAFTIYTGMFWTTLSVMNPVADAQLPKATEALIGATKRLHKVVHPLAGLIGLTAISGAYVAGMDAGRAYNTFPLMDGKIVPDEYFAQWEEKGWRNFFENTAAVQFDHRVLALTTLTSVSAIYAMFRGNYALSSKSKTYLHLLMGTTVAQVTLGISALLYHVPVELGSAHQAGALTLFSVVLALMHSLRGPKRKPALKFEKDLWAHKPAALAR